MADDDSTALAADDATIPNAVDTLDELWRLFYAISGCQYAIAVLDLGPSSDRETRDKVSGLTEAVTYLARHGERLADDAREHASRLSRH